MIDIYAVRLNIMLERSIFNRFMSYLSKQERNRIKKFSRYEDVQKTLIAKALIRNVICKKLGLDNKDLFFEKNEYGKPYLKNLDKIHFNISHSGEWVVCATDDSPVGIDIEMIQPVNFDIAKRFFTKKEFDTLYEKEGSERLLYFYDLWTLKESYIKTDGRGLSIPLDSFSIKISDNNIMMETQNPLRNCFFRQYNIDENYRMAVCSLKKEFPQEVIIKDMNEI